MNERFKAHEEERAYNLRMMKTQRKLQKEQEEMAECRFRPKLNYKTRELSKNRRDIEVPDEFSPKTSKANRFYK